MIFWTCVSLGGLFSIGHSLPLATVHASTALMALSFVPGSVLVLLVLHAPGVLLRACLRSIDGACTNQTSSRRSSRKHKHWPMFLEFICSESSLKVVQTVTGSRSRKIRAPLSTLQHQVQFFVTVACERLGPLLQLCSPLFELEVTVNTAPLKSLQRDREGSL